MIFDCDAILRDGRSIARLWHKENGQVRREELDFQPYLYVKPTKTLDGASLRSHVESLALRAGTRAERLEWVERIEGLAPVRLLKVTVVIANDLAKLRDACQDDKLEVLEADIRFESRVLIDLDVEQFEPREPLKVFVFDIEAFRERGFPKPEVTPIAAFSMAWRDEHGQEQVHLLASEPGHEAEREADLIRSLVDTILTVDPDVIATYNGNKFDWPFLVERARRCAVPLKLGRDGTPAEMGKHEPVCRGRHLIDLLPTAKRDLDTVKVKTLKNVCAALGLLDTTEREMIAGKDLYKTWQQDPEKVKRYARDDAKGTLRLAENFLGKLIPFAKLARARLTDMAHFRRGQQVEHVLMVMSRRQGRVIPSAKQGGEKYEGGFVLDSPRALVEDVELVDFASAYPSVMLTFNISPETYCARPADCPQGKDAHHVSPFDGHHFHKEPEGFVCGALRELKELRKPWRKLASELVEGTVEWAEAYNTQNAYKVAANTIYGILGSPTGRWYHRQAASSVTAWCRDNIQRAIAMAQEMGITPLYGDSDSCFLKAHPRIHEFIDRVNRELGVPLEYKDRYVRVLFVTKKKWAGLKFQKGKPIIEVKGLETKRGDWCGIAKDVQEDVLHKVLLDQDVPGAVAAVRAAVAKLQDGQATRDDLTIYKGMDHPSTYKGLPAHVRAAQRDLDEEDLEELVGSKVPYVVVKLDGASEPVVDLTQPRTEDDLELEDPSTLTARIRLLDALPPAWEPDVAYYIEKQVVPCAARILGIFKLDGRPIDASTLKGERTQARLAEWF